MKCPLTITSEYVLPPGVVARGADCITSECAWWDNKVDCCSILALSQTFIIIENILGHIADQPHL